MDLFRTAIDQPENMLPKDGIVQYFGILISPNDADHYFQYLLNNIQWENDRAIIFGKHITTQRKVAWYADAPFKYSYSNTNKYALAWNKVLLNLKKMVEDKTAERFNSCLLNLYHTGTEGMDWHSDGEKQLKKNGAIASLTLGAERKFSFKHKKSSEVLSIVLEHGSLLLMSGLTQTFWQHKLPVAKKIDLPRINLTFRTIDNQS